jgi:hypothetical protein
MADASDPRDSGTSGEGSGWLVEPTEPALPNEIRITINIGDGQTVSPELKEALETLVRALPTDDVQAYGRPVPGRPGGPLPDPVGPDIAGPTLPGQDLPDLTRPGRMRPGRGGLEDCDIYCKGYTTPPPSPPSPPPPSPYPY